MLVGIVLTAVLDFDEEELGDVVQNFHILVKMR
jgi:hypothetical protein